MHLFIQIRSLFVAGFLIAVSQGIAQEIPSRPNDGIQRNKPDPDRLKIYQQLHLSSEQKQKLVSLQKQQRLRITDIRNNQQLTSAEKEAALKQVFKEQAAKRNALLTPEQQKIWKEQVLGKAAGKNRDVVTVHQRDPHADSSRDVNGLPDKTPSFSKSTLSLTQEQQQKMEALNARFKEKASSVKKNPALSEDEKKEQLAALKKELHQQRKALLTPEQRQQRRNPDSRQTQPLIN
ncbi:hypothetical protein A8C56_21965 [Niabella ginsenosidivorans]|uniref:Uncharacterized protein n=1 Tax=Niabella ginsenosidivorans TaxID=1176587 RepID=A0A1A9I9E4_9BACT|nr:hypothetical protein [Niabella ginsenosidivorans]ANH83291.1 hypothetical protein A8C56_21965 [Niabella ginsenosidivorans]